MAYEDVNLVSAIYIAYRSVQLRLKQIDKKIKQKVGKKYQQIFLQGKQEEKKP